MFPGSCISSLVIRRGCQFSQESCTYPPFLVNSRVVLYAIECQSESVRRTPRLHVFVRISRCAQAALLSMTRCEQQTLRCVGSYSRELICNKRYQKKLWSLIMRSMVPDYRILRSLTQPGEGHGSPDTNGLEFIPNRRKWHNNRYPKKEKCVWRPGT
jgi:hypothetical protein